MRWLATLALLAATVLAATPAGFGAIGPRDAVLTYEPPGQGTAGVHPRRSFESSCYRNSLVRVGVRVDGLEDGRKSTSGQMDVGSFSLTWSGTYKPGPQSFFSGTGSGTWHASSVPKPCRARGNSSGAQSGTFTYSGTPTAKGGAVVHFVFKNFVKGKAAAPAKTTTSPHIA